MKKSLFLLFCLMLNPLDVFSGEMTDVYFNAGTEKYLKGEYVSAVENFEKALEINPNDQKAKDLLIRVIIDAGTNYNLTRDYKKAIKFLEKGLKLEPGNKKIKELYEVTNAMISSNKPVEQENPIIIAEQKRQVKTQKEEIKPTEAVKAAETKVVLLEKQPVPAVKIIQEKPGSKIYFIFLSVFSFVLLILNLVFLLMIKSLKEKLIKKTLSVDQQQIIYESEKLTLLEKLEKDKVLLQQKELEIEKLAIEKRIRQELEVKYTELAKKNAGPEANQVELVREKFINAEQEKLSKYTVDSNIEGNVNIFNTNPSLEMLRDRIAARSRSLFEQSPDAAMNFINEMACNNNPSVRSNIIKALAVIAVPGTIDILFKMNEDKEESVRREVIKSLRYLSSKIRDSEIALPEEYIMKIKDLLHKEIEKGEWVF
ncbi:MAG: hypothetical protein A2252_05230 [Elusimicrobia bacterium RIFOXYA2_FULL_39_19]|nr:MAG: hypothetical protein A2252_05230 [Elusimicrobia bacterium RIFOXYA2_FULL_39_19]